MSVPDWAVALVQTLTTLPEATKPAILAQLRRGIALPLDATLGRLGWLFRRVPEFSLEQAVLGAGLFAWVKGVCPHTVGVNFGQAFGSGSEADKTRREKRFVALLDTDSADLPFQLRQALTLIARENVCLDWALLLQHLCHWDHPDRWVHKLWARGFWALSAAETTAESTPL